MTEEIPLLVLKKKGDVPVSVIPLDGENELPTKFGGPVLPTDSKKCKRCGVYFVDKSAKDCYYHPGNYKEEKFVSIWTCCRQSDRYHRGCKSGHHLEDTVTSLLLSNIPVSEDLVIYSLLKISLNQ